MVTRALISRRFGSRIYHADPAIDIFSSREAANVFKKAYRALGYNVLVLKACRTSPHAGKLLVFRTGS